MSRHHRQQLAHDINRYLDQFEADQADVSETRVLYALMLGQIFKRYFKRFGSRAAGIVVRNLNRIYLTMDRETDQAAAASIDSDLRSKGISFPPPSRPGRQSPGRSPS